MRPQNRSTKRKRYCRRKRQTGSWLNRSDFACAGRDTVNQLGRIAPGVIQNACAEICKFAPTKILRGAIEDVYQTPFRLFGNFDKNQFQKIKNEILK